MIIQGFMEKNIHGIYHKEWNDKNELFIKLLLSYSVL